MASSIYNHKHLQPTGAATQASSSQHSQARLNDCFETIRQEFDVLAQELTLLRGQRDELDNKVNGQVNELNIIRQSLYELETQHGKIRQQYEDELRLLRAENHALRSAGREREAIGLASLGRDRGDPVLPRDPTLKPEPSRDLLRDRDRDLARDRDRDREMGPSAMTRDALGIGRPSVPVGGPGEGLPLTPVGMGANMGPNVGGGYDSFYGRERVAASDRERVPIGPNDRDRIVLSERDRDRMGERALLERERLSEREQRERERLERDGGVKRIKTERIKSDRGGDAFSPSLVHPNALHHPHQNISLGPSVPSSLPGPSTSVPPSTPGAPPHPSVSGAPNAAPNPLSTPTLPGPPSAGPNGSANGLGPGGSSSATPKMPPAPGMGGMGGMNIGGGVLPPPPYAGAQGQGPGQPQGQSQGTEGSGQSSLGNPPFPHTPTGGSSAHPNPSIISTSSGEAPMQVDLSLDPMSVAPEFKKEGQDWFAIFNPSVAGKDGKKRALDVELLYTFMHESVVCCVRFSADGKYLATGCNRTAQIYDTKTGQKTCVLVDEQASKTGDLYIRSVCFSPDGKLLATGAEDKQIRIWDIAKKRIRNVFDGHQQEIYSLDFSRDGRLIVSGSGDKTARIWDMTDGKPHKILSITEDSVDAGVTSVCISPDGRLVAAGSLDTVVRIWDVASGQLIERLKGHRDSVYSVAFTPDGKGLVSGSLDKTLKYWDIRPMLGRRDGPGAMTLGSPSAAKNGAKEGGEKGSQCTMNFTGHKDYVLSVAVSHDGQWVVSGSKDRGVQFWDAKTAVAHCMLQGHKNSVISIDLSPTGSILATGSGDWQARIWSYTAL